MSSAAARFAPRYGLAELPHASAVEDECPTCPTQSEAIGAPPGAGKTADFRDFSGQCPTSPTCPTHFEGVGAQHLSAEGAAGDLLAREREEEPIASAVDAWGLTAEERAESLASLRHTAGQPRDVGHAAGVRQANQSLVDAEAEDTEPYVWVPQSIPQHVMVAGLLAASRIRPADPNRSARVREDADGWKAGVAELQRMLPLDGFSDGQWKSVQWGCAALLEDWSAEMRRLGWSAADGFGVHPEAPATAVQCCGLGVLLNDGHVIEMTDTGAKIRCASGVHQSFTRLACRGAVPIWTVGKRR